MPTINKYVDIDTVEREAKKDLIARMDAEGRMGWHAKITLDRLDGKE